MLVTYADSSLELRFGTHLDLHQGTTARSVGWSYDLEEGMFGKIVGTDSRCQKWIDTIWMLALHGRLYTTISGYHGGISHTEVFLVLHNDTVITYLLLATSRAPSLVVHFPAAY